MTRLAGACLIAVTILAGCSSAGSATGHAPQPSSALPATSSIDPHFDFGQTIVITDAGFRPRVLVSVMGKAVTWVNRSSKPASVDFDLHPVSSGPIQPGATFTWNPRHIESITYHSGTDPAWKARLQVNQNFEG